MKRAGLILVEILLAGIFLTLFLPYVPELSARAAGWGSAERDRFARETADYNEFVATLMQIEQLKAENARLDRVLDAQRRQRIKTARDAEVARKADEEAIRKETNALIARREQAAEQKRRFAEKCLAEYGSASWMTMDYVCAGAVRELRQGH